MKYEGEGRKYACIQAACFAALPEVHHRVTKNSKGTCLTSRAGCHCLHCRFAPRLAYTWGCATDTGIRASNLLFQNNLPGEVPDLHRLQCTPQPWQGAGGWSLSSAFRQAW
jgi:hypothetical protein